MVGLGRRVQTAAPRHGDMGLANSSVDVVDFDEADAG